MKSSTKIYVMQSGLQPALPPHGDLGRSVKYARNSNLKTEESQALKVGTWNARGTNQQGKIQILVEQMAKVNIEILGMAETFWKGETSFQLMAATNQERYTVIMKGGEKSRRGVGFIGRKGIEDMLVMIDSKGDSIAGILLSTKPVETIIVQIYMPTSDCEESVSLAYYEDIEEVMKRLGGRKDSSSNNG